MKNLMAKTASSSMHTLELEAVPIAEVAGCDAHHVALAHLSLSVFAAHLRILPRLQPPSHGYPSCTPECNTDKQSARVSDHECIQGSSIGCRCTKSPQLIECTRGPKESRLKVTGLRSCGHKL